MGAVVSMIILYAGSNLLRKAENRKPIAGDIPCQPLSAGKITCVKWRYAKLGADTDACGQLVSAF